MIRVKSYGQLCAMARALDVVGDRWTLLIVRELLIEDGLRFSELQRGLPGIAPNLLAQRLRDLEATGVLTLVEEGTVKRYRLTARGRQLDGLMRELLKWGAPTVPEAPASAVFQMHWLSQPARYLLRDHTPDAPACRIRFGDLTDGFDLVADGAIRAEPCDATATPAATVNGPGPALVGLLQGAVPLSAAEVAGILIAGDLDALRRVLPQAQDRPAGRDR